MIYAAIGILTAFWGLLWLMRRDTLKRGQEEEKTATQAGVISNVQKANDAVYHLNTDPEFAKRVRDEFTRE